MNQGSLPVKILGFALSLNLLSYQAKAQGQLPPVFPSAAFLQTTAPGAVVFKVENNNPAPIQITEVNYYHTTANQGTCGTSPFPGKVYSLWYNISPSAQTGTSNITAANGWVLAATSPFICQSINGFPSTSIFQNLTAANLPQINNGQTMRLAISVVNGGNTQVPGAMTYTTTATLSTLYTSTGANQPNDVILYTRTNNINYQGTYPNGPWVSGGGFCGYIKFMPATPCGALSPLTVTPAGPITTCAGAVNTLTITNPQPYSGVDYIWQVNDGSGWQNITGANALSYSFNATTTAQYRALDSCENTMLKDSSNIVQVNVNPPVYATVPYMEDFENWDDYCSDNDVPYDGAVNHWTNTPATGNNSWRRNDDGATAAWSSPTGGAYTPASKSGTYSARWHASSATLGTTGNLDLYINCSGQTGNKQLYFYQMNNTNVLADSLIVFLSTNAGLNFVKLAAFDTANTWKRRSVAIPSNSAQTIIRFQGKKMANVAADIGLDSVYIAPPCSGTPNAGSINFPATSNVCAGSVYGMTTIGTSLSGALQYQWQQSADGTNWFNALSPGNNTQFFTTPALYDTTYFRVIVTCGANSDTTDPVEFDVAEPIYAPIPYYQNFENWINRCAISDVPTASWINWPSTGNASWRRNGQGGTAGWTAGGSPPPIFQNFYAQFHTAGTPVGSTGNFDVAVNCSGYIGDKELSFYMHNSNGNDSVRIFYSTDAGASFNPLVSYNTTPTGWEQKVILVPSNAPKTIIRFQGYSDLGSTEIGLDSMKIIPPCDQVNAGTIVSQEPCAGQNFNMQLVNYTQAASLTYVWQYLDQTTGLWTTIPTGNGTAFMTTSILVPTDFRVIVTCTNSNISDTTPVKHVNMASFYYCYCQSGATQTSGIDVGNVTIKSESNQQIVLNNGSGTPTTSNPAANQTYNNYTLSYPTQILYLDTLYRFMVTQINSSSLVQATASIWIDLDHNGTFDIDELVMNKVTSSTVNPASDTFRIPHNDTFVGITGMRVVIQNGSVPMPAPCGTFTNGETEDYLVEIAYAKCDGPVDPGTAHISDTLSCVGYGIILMDTTHEKKRSGITWLWQYSPDGNSWADIAGSTGRDTLEQIVSGETYYRLKMICGFTTDITYSNVVHVAINPYYACYCFSQSIGGENQDSTDIGAFELLGFNVNVGGPHLLNPQAYRARTDYTALTPIELWVDSSYQVKVYHIMRSGNHADAKITLFMDFNNDREYDIPNERVWTAYTSATNFEIVDSITIPHAAITNSITGMRLIINNDVNPNTPSDSACGVYVSGETEDYVVIFKDASLSVNNVSNISQLQLYPNPTSGKFTMSYQAHKPVAEAEITVTNITGQVMMKKQYQKPGVSFTTELDLSEAPRGIYFAELKADNEKIVRKLILK